MSANMSGGRDVPPVSGQVIWLRQIEGELEVSGTQYLDILPC